MTTTQNQLDKFTQAYAGCALWSTTDNADDSGGEPLDANYGIEDISPETLAQMREDCEAFQRDNAELLAEAGLSSERAGFCFWLNRNGHGSGFWDEGNDPVFRKLSDASHVYGSVDLYVGDDGKIYS